MTGKYALFVWGSYALTALVLLWNVAAPRLTRTGALRRLLDPDAPEGVDE